MTPVALPEKGFPDESKPDDWRPSDPPAGLERRPRARLHRPRTNLAGADGPVAAVPAANAPVISVWPGRRMIWGDGTGPTVPLNRRDFMPNPGSCTGIASPGECFYDLMLSNEPHTGDGGRRARRRSRPSSSCAAERRRRGAATRS